MGVEFIFVGVATIFAAWVVFLGGAEWLEGTVKSAFLVHPSAPTWHAAGIKVYVVLTWVGVLVWELLL